MVVTGFLVGSGLFQEDMGCYLAVENKEHSFAWRGLLGNVVRAALVAVWPQLSVHKSWPTFHSVACFVR